MKRQRRDIFRRAVAVLMLALMGLTEVRAAIRPPINGDNTSVANELTAAADGDTVIIRQGNWTWDATTITLNGSKSISILGCGTNSTKLTFTNSQDYINIAGVSAKPLIISDIQFDIANTGSGAGIDIGGNPPTTKWASYSRITRCIFTLRNGRAVSVGYADSEGVLDNCQFVMPAGSTPGNYVVTGGNEYTSWLSANPRGTTNGWFYEDCTFVGTGGYPSNGHTDGYLSAVAQYRHDIFNGSAPSGFHGHDSQVTSMRYAVFSDCVFTNQTAANYAMLTRGGVLDLLRNAVYASGMSTGNCFGLQYYASAWGTYQTSFGNQGYEKTNRFSGTALSATATTLVCTNVPFGNQLSWNSAGSAQEWAGWTIAITGGTGSGQTRTVSASQSTSQTANGTLTFTVGSSFSPTPDNTSTFELRPANNLTWQIGSQPSYKFVTGTPGANREVHIEATLSATLDNLKACINGEDSSSGAKYYASSTLNWDFSCSSKTATTLVLHNIQDGAGTLGYPGAQQEGVIGMVKGTNTGVVLLPCVSKGNTLNGSPVGFDLVYKSDYGGPEFNTNSVVAGRDYYETNTWPVTEVTYPLPIRSTLAPNDVVVTVASSGASPTLTTTEDLFAGTGAGARTYHVGEEVTLTAPSTSGGSNFSKWQRDGADYSTNVTISTYIVDSARTFAAVYVAPPAQSPKTRKSAGLIPRRF